VQGFNTVYLSPPVATSKYYVVYGQGASFQDGMPSLVATQPVTVQKTSDFFVAFDPTGGNTFDVVVVVI
jgi:hypothetical protein